MSEAVEEKAVPKVQNELSESSPDLLILGDSISLGYTPVVAAKLAGKVNVWRPEMNCGSTLVYKEHLLQWLGGRKWDMIHFNCGLHDINRSGNAAINRTDGERRVPVEEYLENLEWITDAILAASKRVVWASTTPVPPETVGRTPGDEIEYNKAAEKLMKRKNIQINDLHSFILPFSPDCHPAPDNVHYTDEGYGKLGDEVARVALAGLF
jgi:acyl-CoA thioesterase-1